ncbi:MarR family winged helix-turn-helix transcriptional regulator [Alicyclobacillus acidoterrestris]|uniref:MarR family transcriptional regulator n=1 Tax=Alicyclobacillus acidoterrestris (strain ATCC 49025 / DSM 3922 / CIP 106132 / NCIMB 13137 / GD3B) TaxID=1356854 RepID=A0A9E6ZDN3_ALIAG|nr:MarR family transcriptional regulator [Alicyclobacillus acidoterrestris]UNO47307.1 MarR family transcriptional regulator [Alicyclobacillus acidoterrestris]
MTIRILIISIQIMKHKEIYTNCLAFQLTQARKKVFAWYGNYLKPLGLTPASVYVLGVLRDKEYATPSEISHLLELERPTVTTLLSRMERSGLVNRALNPSNRRETLVSLTDTGKEACDKAYPLLVEADKALNTVLNGAFAQVKEQVENLNRMLQEAAE